MERNLKLLNKLLNMKELEGGVVLDLAGSFGKDNTPFDTKAYFCLSSDWCPSEDDGFTVITLPNGSYDATFVLLPGKSSDAGAALELAVKFAIQNELPFDYFDIADISEEEQNDWILIGEVYVPSWVLVDTADSFCYDPEVGIRFEKA